MNSVHELLDQIMYDLKDPMDELGKALIKKVQDYIFARVYMSRKPNYYRRSYNFKDSVSKSKTKLSGQGTRYSYRIFFDKRKIKSRYLQDYDYNQHMDMRQNAVKDITLEVLELGTKKPNPYYMHKGAFSMRDTLKNFQDRLVDEHIVKAMKQKGYHITKV